MYSVTFSFLFMFFWIFVSSYLSLYTLEALSNDAEKCLFRQIYNKHHRDILPPLCTSISYLQPKFI